MMDSDAESIRPLLVEGKVVEDPDLIARHEIPERGLRGKARFVVQPGTVEEVSAVAAWAYRTRSRFVIQGANSGLVGASTPDSSGTQAVLSLERVNRILDLSPDDRVAVVEGGVTLSQLNSALAGEGLFLPIELASDPTIGGLVATNAGGARTIRYGNMGKRVLSLQAVLADETGSLVGSVSRVGKDNSRLNLGRMFVGSFGALGVVGRVAVRVAPIPTRVATGFLAMRSRHHVLSVIVQFEKVFGENLSAFELMSGDAIRLAMSNVAGLRPPFPVMDAEYVLVEVASHDELDLEGRLAGLVDRIAVRSNSPIVDAVIAPPKDLWKIRHSLSEGVRGAGATVRFDVAVPRASLALLHDRVEEAFSDDPTPPLVTEFGHWAEGGTHMQLVYTSGVLPDDLETVRARVYSIVVDELGGSFSAEHGLGPYNTPFYRRFIPPREQALERRIKEFFDPHLVWGAAPFVSESGPPEGERSQ